MIQVIKSADINRLKNKGFILLLILIAAHLETSR